MLVLKLKFGKDIRRIPSPTVQSSGLEESKLTFQELSRLALECFKSEDTSEFVFQYKDDEKDLITITNDLELEEGLRLARSVSRSSDSPVVFSVKVSRKGQTECPIKCGLDSAVSCIHKAVEKFKEKRALCKKNDTSGCCFRGGRCSPFKIALKLFGLFFLIKLFFFCQCCFFFIPLLAVAGFGIKRFICSRSSSSCPVSLCSRRQIPVPSPQHVNQNRNPNPEVVEVESKQEVEEDEPQPNREELPFQLKLRQLEEMGFSSRSRNIEVLIRNGGDVLRAVKDLLDKHN